MFFLTEHPSCCCCFAMNFIIDVIFVITTGIPSPLPPAHTSSSSSSYTEIVDVLVFDQPKSYPYLIPYIQ